MKVDTKANSPVYEATSYELVFKAMEFQANWLPGSRFAIISTVKQALNLGDCSISHTDNAIFQGLKFKSGAKIGSKMFSKKFSKFLEDSPKNSPIFLEILQKYWRISNIIGESPKIKLENALIVV